MRKGREPKQRRHCSVPVRKQPLISHPTLHPGSETVPKFQSERHETASLLTTETDNRGPLGLRGKHTAS